MSNVNNGNLISKEDLISMFLGLAIVAIVMVVLVNFFKSRSGRVDLAGVVDTAETGDQDQTVDGNGENQTGLDYTVEAGDSLWSIAVKKYGDGFKWIEIAKANGIDEEKAGQIEIGQGLKLPEEVVGMVSLPTEHMVESGESLSKIALNYYGDMFAWEKIYEANKTNILDPNLIEIGMKLVIPE